MPVMYETVSCVYVEETMNKIINALRHAAKQYLYEADAFAELYADDKRIFGDYAEYIANSRRDAATEEEGA